MTLDSFNTFVVTVTPQRVFEDVCPPSWARSVVFGLILDLHVLPYFVDYSRTGAGCAFRTGSLLLLANAISDKLVLFLSGSNPQFLSKHDTHGTKRIAQKSSLNIRRHV